MTNKHNPLDNEERRVIIEKGTEAPFSGQYNDFIEGGLYLCKQCDAPLYSSQHKFQSSCGWPSFDNEIEGAVRREMDEDGRRTEILCANCDGHLGHVFEGEMLTDKNLRHCVNSVSLKFVSSDEIKEEDSTIQTAYFAGGCFWGVEHLMNQQSGVVSVESGYMGGDVENPSYEQVCSKTTGHLEVVEVSYHPQQVSFETLTKLFFEIHDPTQSDGQGPDIGSQYLSAIFYQQDDEKQVGEKLISILEEKGLNIATKLLPVSTFWKAEDYHQDYYQKNGQQPYCHRYEKRF